MLRRLKRKHITTEVGYEKNNGYTIGMELLLFIWGLFIAKYRVSTV